MGEGRGGGGGVANGNKKRKMERQLRKLQGDKVTDKQFFGMA
jgi:hypothetical protein